MGNVQKSRARGVLLGQFIGDALGTTVEFRSARGIARDFPEGLTDIVGGGPFDMEPGQVTDDGEMALALARTLLEHGLDPDARSLAYVKWLRSNPPDKGSTTTRALSVPGKDVTAEQLLCQAMKHNGKAHQQANGALMRVSPLAIYLAHASPEVVIEKACEDARFTHPSPVCQVANAAFIRAIQVGIQGGSRSEGWEAARQVAEEAGEQAVSEALNNVSNPPVCDEQHIGWVLIALRCAFHHLQADGTLENGIVSAVMAGGDTDTNGAITGALLGAFHGEEAVPERWTERIHSCAPASRPPRYHVEDARKLADALLKRGSDSNHLFGSTPVDKKAKGGKARTSSSHPIRVDWLPDVPGGGRVGLTIAPGKHSTAKYGNHSWARDTVMDLERLKEEFGIELIICLLEDQEMRRLKNDDLVPRAEALGLAVHRLPIPDGGTLPDPNQVTPTVKTINAAVAAGKNVVIHCQGGLGRAGTIGGCYLVDNGIDPEEALQILATHRSPKCPETRRQKDFIRAYAKH